MKMLMITKGVASEYFHTHRDFIDFFPQIVLTALTYETPMFQDFRTHACSITILFPIWFYVYALFFKVNCFFQGIVRCQCLLS